jgi:hypothetical protein
MRKGATMKYTLRPIRAGYIVTARRDETYDDACLLMKYPSYDDVRPKAVAVGDVGVLMIARDEKPGNPLVEVWLYADLDGFPGNMDGSIKETRGWRGTTNGVCRRALGVHSVTWIRRTRNSIAVRFDEVAE